MLLLGSEKIVIKIGTSTLSHPNGTLNLKRIEHLVRVVSDLQNSGHHIILVSSGAVGAGSTKLGFEKKPDSIILKQSAAAVGQCDLMAMYSKFFCEYGYNIAQILLTKDVIEDEHRKQNAQNTLNMLLDLNVIPIVNENDVISSEELKLEFGDNDTLSSIVSGLVGADLLILLSDIDGMYDKNPKLYEDATLIKKITEIDEKIESFAQTSSTNQGTGGMLTKLSAAKICFKYGINMIIANGENPDILYDIAQGKEVGTLFSSKG